MGLILNAPLPTTLLARDYDNKILMAFLGLLLTLMLLGLVIINLSNSQTSNTDKEKTPAIVLSA